MSPESRGSSSVAIDVHASARRIAGDISTLSGPAFTRSATTICRYAYTEEYDNTVRFVAERLAELGFVTAQDPVGNLIARNRPNGENVFSIGSHCDSNRNGGKFDGTLGVVVALEVCRLNDEFGLHLPLQVIVPFEEEASGFGRAMLGSQIMSQTITEDELRRLCSIDDGEPFWSHAQRAGFQPDRWRECSAPLDTTMAWIELHIEQGRVLQDAGERIGIVDAIVGIVHGDVVIRGRADHAGATPMDLRLDAGVSAAELVLELTTLARGARSRVVATGGEVSWEPGLINVVPERVQLGIDVRGPDAAELDGVLEEALRRVRESAEAQGLEFSYAERTRVAPAAMDAAVVAALTRAAEASGAPYRRMTSGACHDTMHFARLVPSAMVFVPCRDGVSHSPAEHAEPADAALGAEIVLNALFALAADRPAVMDQAS